MKKTLIALAATTCMCGAFAQTSTVTLFGVVDAGVGHYSTDNVASKTAAVSSGTSSSFLGFKGH